AGRSSLARSKRSLLFGDDLVFDFVVCGLRDDFLADKVVFRPVWPPIDDFFGLGLAYTRQGTELFFGGGIDVQLLGCGGGFGSVRLGRSCIGAYQLGDITRFGSLFNSSSRLRHGKTLR